MTIADMSIVDRNAAAWNKAQMQASARCKARHRDAIPGHVWPQAGHNLGDSEYIAVECVRDGNVITHVVIHFPKKNINGVHNVKYPMHRL